MSGLLEYALQYAKLGWRIFPLAPGEKKPITAHGVKDATNEEAQIRDWWDRWPSANIGLACGAGSGVYVIDIDLDQEKGINGYESLSQLGELPATVCQSTPRGGCHAFFTTDAPPSNKNGLRPGIDIRGDGYYVVLAPSVHPNGGVYQWSPGCSPWDMAPSLYPDFMRVERVRGDVSEPSGREVPVRPLLASPIQSNGGTRSDGLERARLYFERVEPAIQGSRGHDCLLWAAQCCVNGLKMGDEEAYAFLASEYNPRCVPPWNLSEPKDERDFRRKIDQARKNPTNKFPYGWIADDPAYAVADLSSCAIDVARLIASAKLKPPGSSVLIRNMLNSKSAESKRELEYLCKPIGLAGEICSWINSTAMKPQPFLTLACTIAFMGTLFGRKVRDTLGSRTNIYCMGVAPSSAGKAHAPNQIRKLAGAAGCVSLLGGDDIASDSAIEERVSREPATLFMWDEVGLLLSHIKSGADHHNAKVVQLLMKLFSAAGNVYLGREYSDSEKQRTITQPCCSIYGTSTPERFASGLSQQELQDGWLSRCLVFRSEYDPRKMRDVDPEQPPPESLVKNVRSWHQYKVAPSEENVNVSDFVGEGFQRQPPKQLVIPTASDAERMFVELDDYAISQGKLYPILACLWAKAEENARRIALTIATGDGLDELMIRIEVAEFACRLVKFILTDFAINVVPEIVDSEYEKGKRRILAVIKAIGLDGAKKTDITKQTQWAKKIVRDEMLTDMIEAELIVCAKKPGDDANYYWSYEDFRRIVRGE